MVHIKKVIPEWIMTILIAVVLSLVVRTYIAEARWIPSESMVPTLEVGDHLLIDKISLKFKEVNRGDIVVFKAPPAVHKDEDLIKRVIGLPGEKIAVKSGVVYINGQPLKETYIAEKPTEDFKTFTVPENQVFVMGDNRNKSYDSRYWGTLPIDDIIGKAVLCYYPLADMKIFNN